MFHDLSRESLLNLGSKPKEMIPPECSLEKKWLFWITYRSNSKGSFIGTQTVYSQPQCYRVFSTQQLLTTLIYPWRKDFRSLHCLCSPSVTPPMDPSSGGLFLFNTAVFVSSLGGKEVNGSLDYSQSHIFYFWSQSWLVPSSEKLQFSPGVSMKFQNTFSNFDLLWILIFKVYL